MALGGGGKRLLHRQHGFRSLQLLFEDAAHLRNPAFPRGLAACLGRSERAQVKILDAALAERSGQRGLGEAGPPRCRHGANVDQQLDSGLAKLAQELVLGFAFIADRREPHGRLQSNSSSRKLFFLFP